MNEIYEEVSIKPIIQNEKGGTNKRRRHFQGIKGLHCCCNLIFLFLNDKENMKKLFNGFNYLFLFSRNRNLNSSQFDVSRFPGNTIFLFRINFCGMRKNTYTPIYNQLSLELYILFSGLNILWIFIFQECLIPFCFKLFMWLCGSLTLTKPNKAYNQHIHLLSNTDINSLYCCQKHNQLTSYLDNYVH